MSGRPSWDAAEIARSALSELPEPERITLLVSILCESANLSALVCGRNALSLHIADLIAARFDEAAE